MPLWSYPRFPALLTTIIATVIVGYRQVHMSPLYKIVLLGDSSVGKTSLVYRLTADKFDPNLPNTIGAAFISKEHSKDDKTVKFEIWDTAGQERYKSLTPMYYRNAKEALVCFDLSCPESSFERARYWVDQLKLLGPSDIKIRVVGNKKDLVDENQVDLLRINEYCNDNGVPMHTTSAKLGDGVMTLFDSIVGLIDQSFFDNHNDLSESLPQPISLLDVRSRTSTCC